MKNGRKIIVAIMFIIGVIALLVGSVAYYRIVVEGSIKGTTGNAVFVLKDSDDSVWNNKVIDLGKVNPSDSGEFTVTMDATGSVVDMYATLEIERSNLPTNLKFYTTSDYKSELHKYYSFLEKSGTNSETLTIYWYWNPYINDEEDSKFINVSNLEANVRVSAIQISQYAMMKNGYSGSSSANGGTEFWNNTYKSYIRTIEFGNDLSDLPSSCTEENLCWDISYSTSQKKKVYSYLVDSGLTVSETDSSTSTTTEKILYNLYVVSEAPIFSAINSACIFMNFKNLTQINFNNNFNTSKVTNMVGMFSWCQSLTTLDLNSFNTQNVIDMVNMFYHCSSLTSLDLSSFNTTNITSMSHMFERCSSLTNLNLSSFNTANVTDMDGMFDDCSSLTTLNLSSFDTTNVASMPYMFWDCLSLTSLDLSSFNMANVTNMDRMFYNCSSLTNLNLSSFNTTNVTNMGGMFYNCSSLTNLDLSNFNTINVTNMGGMFHGCSSLTSLDLSNFNTINVTNMGGMFHGCSSLEKLNLSNFDTSKVEIYYQYSNSIFQGCTKLQTEITIMNPNVTEENYKNMFDRAATDPNAEIVVNYTSETETLVDNMIATKSSNSNVVKGIQI